MSLSLAELKGLAVGRMNADPVVSLMHGHSLQRNFILEVERAWGYPALRFGEHVHLLAVPDAPAGLLPSRFGHQCFLVVTNVRAERARQTLLGLPAQQIRIEAVTDQPTEAIDFASAAGAGFEFIRKALAGDFKGKDPVPKAEPEEETIPTGDPLGGIDLGLFDDCSAKPPTLDSLANLVARVRQVHSSNPETSRHWNSFQLNLGASFTNAPALIVGNRYELFHSADVPAGFFEEDCDSLDPNLTHAGIAVVVRNQRKLDTTIRGLLPNLPVETYGVVAFRNSWGGALMKAMVEWFTHEIEGALRKTLEAED